MGALRIVFLGSDAIALPLLDSLATNPAVELAGVFTQPDRATGRHRQSAQRRAAERAAEREAAAFAALDSLLDEVQG